MQNLQNLHYFTFENNFILYRIVALTDVAASTSVQVVVMGALKFENSKHENDAQLKNAT